MHGRHDCNTEPGRKIVRSGAPDPWMRIGINCANLNYNRSHSRDLHNSFVPAAGHKGMAYSLHTRRVCLDVCLARRRKLALAALWSANRRSPACGRESDHAGLGRHHTCPETAVWLTHFEVVDEARTPDSGHRPVISPTAINLVDPV